MCGCNALLNEELRHADWEGKIPQSVLLALDLARNAVLNASTAGFTLEERLAHLADARKKLAALPHTLEPAEVAA